MKKFTKDLAHYLPLIAVLFFGTVGFLIFSYDKLFQVFITFAMAASYFTWGLIHHYLHEDLHLSVVIEYFAIALIGVVAILSVLLRS